MQDYYALLGVPRDASDGDIKASFRLFSRIWHPDVNKRPDAAGRFRELSAARDVLLDPAARAEHDRELDGGTPNAGGEAGFPPGGSARTPVVIHVEPESIDFGLLRSGGAAAEAEVLVSWEGAKPDQLTAGPYISEWWKLLPFENRGTNVVAIRLLARAPAGMTGGRRSALVEIRADGTVYGVELKMTASRAPAARPTANDDWIPVKDYLRRNRAASRPARATPFRSG